MPWAEDPQAKQARAKCGLEWVVRDASRTIYSMKMVVYRSGIVSINTRRLIALKWNGTRIMELRGDSRSGSVKR